MQALIDSLARSRFRLAVAVLATGAVVAGGATYGSWVVGSDAGNAYAKAVSAQNLTLSGTAGAADLWPGKTAAAVKVTVTNPNAFAVTITTVAGAGTITSDKGATCDADTGVTFTDATGLSQAVAAGATVSFSLAKAAMSNASVTECQGAVFTIPVTLTATS